MLAVLTACTAFARREFVHDDSTFYREHYRPQYHFTPAHRWIGDPCGTIKHNGKYMAYSWGCACSDDLIHWTELNTHAIKGLPKDVATFTGGVVVDKDNCAGYGKNALIAAFTSFDENSKKQSQSIAFSRDGGVNFQYYDLNPVIDIWSTEFRDPTVVWDAERNRWVMLVAKALEKKVAFYSSTDLKHWSRLSEFGPMGDSERSWECPDMFQLPVEGTDRKKWVLLLSINWAREQYFVGEFDGEKFTPDSINAAPVYVDDGLDYYASRVFQNYDEPDCDDVYTIGWVNTWDYAVPAPSTWGKGVWSIPRKMTLVETTEGLRIRQRPVAALDQLQGEPVVQKLRLKSGTRKLPVDKYANTYRICAKIDTRNPDVVGLNLCAGDGRKCVVSYDTQSHCLKCDRTNTADVSLPRFDRVAFVKLPDVAECLQLDILVDKSTIEIFADDGRHVMTLLTYAGEGQTGAEVFSLYGNTDVQLQIYPINSIWH